MGDAGTRSSVWKRVPHTSGPNTTTRINVENTNLDVQYSMSPPPRDVHILELEGNQIHISIYEYSEEFKPIEDPKIAIR
jgi:hypothetical protein